MVSLDQFPDHFYDGVVAQFLTAWWRNFRKGVNLRTRSPLGPLYQAALIETR
jgi:hypothetical protein